MGGRLIVVEIKGPQPHGARLAKPLRDERRQIEARDMHGVEAAAVSPFKVP
jgi:hypothetical protein